MNSSSEKDQINLDCPAGKTKVVSVATPIRYIIAGEKVMLRKAEEMKKEKRRKERKKRNLRQVLLILIKKAWKNY